MDINNNPSNLINSTPIEPTTPSSSKNNNPGDMFHRMVLLTENLNMLKRHINVEKQVHCNDSAHTDPILANKEELDVPVMSVPISALLLPVLPLSGESLMTFEDIPSQPLPSTLMDDVHISTLVHAHIPMPPSPLTTTISTPAPPGLSATDWSLPINKVQSGNVPSITITPKAASSSVNLVPNTPLSKIFTTDSAVFSMEPDPSALPDCLIQMALNPVFIPLSIITTDSLNRIKTSKNVKYKRINYGSGASKHFLDDASFPPEDDLNHFESF